MIIRCRILLSLVIGLCLVGMTLECYGGGAKKIKLPSFFSASHPKTGPPPWAPAHGHRSKYHYRYYPSSHIYFDVRRGVYFYLSGAKWLKSPTPPAGIHIEINHFVTLDMDFDRPYKFHSEVIKRYPPGHKKKLNKRKKKGKGKKNR
jgi:hypothetical protein